MISTRGRYALRVMADLALHDTDGFISLKDIAARQDLSKHYLESIMPLLADAALVESQRGAGGGYRLTRSAQDYTVAEILLATDEELAPVACLKPEAPYCDKTPHCPTLRLWREYHALTIRFFSEKTLADVVPELSAPEDGAAAGRE